MDDEPARAPSAATQPAPKDAPPPWLSAAIKQGIVWAIGAVLLTLAALWFLGQVRELVRYLAIATLLWIALEPAVIWLHDKRGWRRGSATGLLLLAVFLAVVLFAVGLASVLAKEANQVIRDLPRYVDKLNDFTRDAFNTTVISAGQRAEAANAAQNIREYLTQHMDDVLGGAASVLGGIFTLFTIGLFTFYLTANGPKVRHALLSRLPPAKQERARFAWETSIRQVGGYLYSRLLLSAINAFFMFVTLLIVGSPFALPLAVFQGLVAEFIPIVGTYIAGAIPLVVVLAEVGPVAALIVLIEIVVYQQIENYVLSPKISAKTMELNAGVAFGAALAGGSVGGLIGAFFALPIAATIQAFISEYSRRYEVEDSELTRVEEPPSEPPKKGLRERLRRRKADAPDPDAFSDRSETS
ncbi:MAG TPA: AI-2E family transporter [Actinomycetota bacterium]|nr:AI-2E family transporter [Actinomycetota bacterium]